MTATTKKRVAAPAPAPVQTTTAQTTDEFAHNAGVAVHNGIETGVKAGAAVIGGVITGLFAFGKGLLKGN